MRLVWMAFLIISIGAVRPAGGADKPLVVELWPGVAPEESVIVGDSSNDILTGRNAGMWTCGLTYGLAPQTLEIAPPDALVDKPEELPRVFGVQLASETTDAT